jgi:hypothetical protein
VGIISFEILYLYKMHLYAIAAHYAPEQPPGGGQSRGMSLVETVASTAIGLFINTVANYLVLPLWGLHPSVGDSIALAVVFTGLSLARGFMLRRGFEWVRRTWGNVL